VPGVAGLLRPVSGLGRVAHDEAGTTGVPLPREHEVLLGVLGDDPPVDVLLRVATFEVLAQLLAAPEVLATEVTPVVFVRHVPPSPRWPPTGVAVGAASRVVGEFILGLLPFVLGATFLGRLPLFEFLLQFPLALAFLLRRGLLFA
jgi:hypothetical protein